MYHVHARVGRKTEVIAESRRKAEAIAAADAHPHRATVTKAYSADVIHNNGVDECWGDTVANALLAQRMA